MRPHLPLIALGLGTAIALSTIDPASAQSTPQELTLAGKEDDSRKKPDVAIASVATVSTSAVAPPEAIPSQTTPSGSTTATPTPTAPTPTGSNQSGASSGNEVATSPAPTSVTTDSATAGDVPSGQETITHSPAGAVAQNAPPGDAPASREPAANPSTTPINPEATPAAAGSQPSSMPTSEPGATAPLTDEAASPASPDGAAPVVRGTNQPLPVAAPETIPPATSAAPSRPAGATPTDGQGGDRAQATPSAPNAPSTETAPAYLNPDPNPLLFPTRPEEVQVVGTQPITLEQALELAQRNSRELQQSQLELEQRRAQLREALAERLPTLQVGAGITASENQTQNPLQVQEADDVNFSVNGTVQLNYDVFTGGRRAAVIAAAEGRVRFQELQTETVAEQLRLDVVDEYYDVQQRDEEVRIAESTVEENLRSLRDAEAQERAGVGTRFDVLQAQVDLANAQQELTQARSQQRIARRQLVQRLGLSEQVDIAAADPVEAAGRWNLTLEESIVLAYRNRAELEQQLVQRGISEEQRRAALGNLLPQVSAFAQYDIANLLNGEDGNTDFNDDYSIGVRVSLTLFDGGQARARARQEEINAQLSESQFAQIRNQVRFQVEQAYLGLQANFANIRTTELAVTQAEEALRLARLRFQAGVGTQSDVLRSQTALTRAEVDRLRAILGYNRSLVQLQRFVSNLPEGNLYETP